MVDKLKRWQPKGYRKLVNTQKHKRNRQQHKGVARVEQRTK